MRLRRPEPRPFTVALGVLVGLAGYLATPPPWPTDPVLSLGVGGCVALVVWVVLEQAPDAVDRAVEARAYWLVAGLGVLVGVVFGSTPFGGPTPDDGTRLRVVFFALGALVVTSVGRDHRGRLLLEREEVRARVTATESRLREVAFSLVGVATGAYVFSLVIGSSVPAAAAIGSLIGVAIGSVFTDTTEYRLVALDDHLLFRRGTRGGTTAVPWRRVRDVSVDGDTLRIARGLPYPMVYEADLSAVEDRRAVLRAFRSYPTLH